MAGFAKDVGDMSINCSIWAFLCLDPAVLLGKDCVAFPPSKLLSKYRDQSNQNQFSHREFQTCYLARDDRFPEACWVPLLSDFDLEMAFIK